MITGSANQAKLPTMLSSDAIPYFLPSFLTSDLHCPFATLTLALLNLLFLFYQSSSQLPVHSILFERYASVEKPTESLIDELVRSDIES